MIQCVPLGGDSDIPFCSLGSLVETLSQASTNELGRLFCMKNRGVPRLVVVRGRGSRFGPGT